MDYPVKNHLRWVIYFLVINYMHCCRGQTCPNNLFCLQCNDKLAVCQNTAKHMTCPKNLPVTLTTLTMVDTAGCGTVLNATVLKSLIKLETFIASPFAFDTIASDAFFHNDNLKTIQLKSGNLILIEGGAFNGIPDLNLLDLSKNNIKETAIKGSSPLSPLTSLQRLQLDDNKLTGIHPNLFKGLKTLQQLHLAYNQIAQIHPKAFTDLTNLEDLYLSSNKLNKLSSWLSTTGHVYNTIDLSSNNIANLNPTDLRQIKVKTLKLKDNPMTSIKTESFKDVLIKELDLRGTKLRSLPENLRDALNDPKSKSDGNLLLGGVTGWRCDYESLWLAKFLSAHLKSSSPTCGLNSLVSSVQSRELKNVVDTLRRKCLLTTTSTTTPTTTTATATTTTKTKTNPIISPTNPTTTTTTAKTSTTTSGTIPTIAQTTTDQRPMTQTNTTSRKSMSSSLMTKRGDNESIIQKSGVDCNEDLFKAISVVVGVALGALLITIAAVVIIYFVNQRLKNKNRLYPFKREEKEVSVMREYDGLEVRSRNKMWTNPVLDF